MSSPTTATIKKLSMLSGNTCAFPKCTMSLVDESSGSITAQICHIKAKNSGGARYDSNQTNEERDSFENLVLMCPIHHKIIDDDEISYTVERLQQIKKDHESKNSTNSDFETSKIEKILEDYLRPLKADGNNQNKSSAEIIKQENSALMKAQNLAQKKIHEQKRQDWFHSHNGLVDGINSINEIFNLIHRKISDNVDTFSTIGIGLISKEKLLRVIQTYQFGCQIEVKGYLVGNPYDNKLSKLKIHIVLYKKRPTHQGGFFYTDGITEIKLKPDLTINDEIVWRNEIDNLMVLTAEQVCEKFYDLLLTEITKDKPPDETIPGGRYYVDGRFVDAWNNPIDDDGDYYL